MAPIDLCNRFNVLEPVTRAEYNICNRLQKGLFQIARCRSEGAPIMLTRTGCTGEIGYELFFERSSAPRGSGRMCWKPCSTPPRGRESRPASRSCSARFLTGLSLGDKISRIRRILRGHARLRGTWRHSERRDRSRRRRARHILGRAALGRVPKPEERMAPAA